MVKSRVRCHIVAYCTSIEYNIRLSGDIHTAAKGRYLILSGERLRLSWSSTSLVSTQAAKPALGKVAADFAIGKRYVTAFVDEHAAAVAAVPSVVADITIMKRPIIINQP